MIASAMLSGSQLGCTARPSAYGDYGRGPYGGYAYGKIDMPCSWDGGVVMAFAMLSGSQLGFIATLTSHGANGHGSNNGYTYHKMVRPCS